MLMHEEYMCDESYLPLTSWHEVNEERLDRQLREQTTVLSNKSV